MAATQSALLAMPARWRRRRVYLRLASSGSRSRAIHSIVKLFLIGLPALALGTWLGFKLYGRLDDAMFRKAVLVLLISGVTLVI